MWSRLVTVLTVLAGIAVGTAAPALALGDRARVVLTIRDPRVTESSGLAASVLHPGVLYTHNDSGDAPRVFAIGPDGGVLAVLTLGGASARDWEAMAAGRDDAGRPALFVGDIGDNLHGAWPSVSVYRVPEPSTLRRTNRLYVATKEDGGGGLYRAPARLRTDRVNVLHRVASVPPTITDGAFSPDGRTFVLRGYLDAHVYSAPGREVASLDLPLQFQGESITYTRDGKDVLVGSEGAGSEVWRVPLPAAVAPKAPATSSRSPGMQAPERTDPAASGPSHRGRDAAALLAAVGGAALLAAVARRRRR